MNFNRFKEEYPNSSIKIYKSLSDIVDELDFVERNTKDFFLIEDIEKFKKDLIKYRDSLYIEKSQLYMFEAKRDYAFDPFESYSILEDFTYTKPRKLRVGDEEYEVSSHKDMYIKLLKYLRKNFPKEFRKLVKSKKFNGKKRKYFSNKKEDLRRPIWIASGIYADTFFDANGFRDVIINFVRELNLDYKMILIYLSESRR